jgi:hypothetical protein
VDVDQDERVDALLAVYRTESPSDTVVQLRLAIRTSSDPPDA